MTASTSMPTTPPAIPPARLALEEGGGGVADATVGDVLLLSSSLLPMLASVSVPSSSADALIFANTDAASGVRNILKMCANGLEVGPILMGMGNKAHIVTSSITARGLLNIAALAGTPVQTYS